MIEIEPRNAVASAVVEKVIGKIDGRLSLDDAEVRRNIYFAMANAHKASFNLSGSEKTIKALRETGVFKRAQGTRGHFVNPLFVEFEALWQTVETEPHFPSLLNKSGCYFRNSHDARSLAYDDVAALANKKPILIEFVDMENTIAAWENKYSPGLKFDKCDYVGSDVARDFATDYLSSLIGSARLKKLPVAQISNGLVVSTTEFVRFMDAQTTRFTNDSTKRFALKVTDSIGREFYRMGVY